MQSGSTTWSYQQYGYDALGRPECVALRMNPALFGSTATPACSLGTAGSYGPDRIVRTVRSPNADPYAPDQTCQASKKRKSAAAAPRRSVSARMFSSAWWLT